MRLTVDEVLAEVAVSREELELCLDECWVLPSKEAGTLAFDEVDLARLRLIAELRGLLAVNDEAMPLVLRLIDQLHLLRECLGAMGNALRELPPRERQRIERLILDRFAR